MSTDCKISFDHPYGVYNSGNTLNGHVKLQTRKSKSIRGISIKIVGYGKVYWSKSTKNSPEFKSHEQYLNTINYVVGSAEGHSFDFATGSYEYTFSCELPIELPTSMIEDNCQVIYQVIVTIDRRLRFDNIFKQDFSVNHISDLNFMEINRLPRKNMSIMEVTDIFSLCWSDNGDIKAELDIPYDGFVPGQQIPYKLTVYNDSNNDLSGPEIKLLKFYALESIKPSVQEKVVEKLLIIKSFKEIPRHTIKEFQDTIDVPYIPPSHSTRFIRMGYKINVKISGKSYMKKLYVELPITIGTIPLVDFDKNSFPMLRDPNNSGMIVQLPLQN